MTKKQLTELILRSIENAESGSILLRAKLITTGCCPACLKLNGKEMSMEELKRTMPIPYNKCKREWGCNCTVAYVTVLDENGMPISK